MSVIGTSLPRVDGADRITGGLRYAVDICLPRMLHGAVVRSPHPCARIVRVDISEARNMPGVHAVITGNDESWRIGGMIADQSCIAVDRVRHIGEAVAAVAADTPLLAQMAADAVRVEYETLPAVFDMEKALLSDAPLVHDKPSGYRRGTKYQAHDGTNICHLHQVSTGDDALEQAFATAKHIFEDTFEVPAIAHTPMEPYASTAVFSPVTGEYTIWSATDAPHRRVKELADALGVPTERIRLISTAMGGGFGGRGTPLTEMLVVALARHTAGRPVQLVFSREEVLTVSHTRVPAKLCLRTAVDGDGILIARQADLLWDNGAYAAKAPEVASRGGMTVTGPYRIPHVAIRSTLIYTNKQPSAAFRGFGTTQSAFACEVHMDRIASALNLDPLEFRLRNAFQEGDIHFSGQKMVGVGLHEALIRAAEAIGWNTPRPPAPAGKRYGRGLACMLKGTNTPTVSTCLVRLVQDGCLQVLSSAVEVGAGQKTVMTQIAAEAFGLLPNHIRIAQPDTAFTPYDFGCTSSRNTFHMGNALIMACRDARQRFLEALASVLNLPASEFSIKNSIVYHKTGLCMTMQEGMKKVCPRGTEFMGQGTYSPEGSALLAHYSDMKTEGSIFWLFVCHAVEVEVDEATGRTRVLKVAAAHDVGKALNPLNCIQQIEGSVIMGASLALLEELQSVDGKIGNATLLDYKFATSGDMPDSIETILVESHHPEAPYGAKGVGEPAAAATAPAIANAIHDACGVWMHRTPITPERLLAAMRAAQGKES